MLFDWIMTTFTGGDEPPQQPDPASPVQTAPSQPNADPEQAVEKLRVKVKLTEVRAILNDDGNQLATLSLQAADVSVLLRGPTMRVAARVGNLLLTDDYDSPGLPVYRQLLTIEGDNLADFQYETYDPTDSTYPGYDSMVYLRSGSFKFTFIEDTVHRIIRFLTKFARMKAVYDAATQAAAQQATDLQNQANKMHYDVLVRTPILVFPRGLESHDSIVANLGEFSVNNRFSKEGVMSITHIDAALSKIRLSSQSVVSGREEIIQMLKDVDLSFDITMVEGAQRSPDSKSRPDTEVSTALHALATAYDTSRLNLLRFQIIGHMSDVRINMTAIQYAFLLELSHSIPRTFATTDEEEAEDEDMEAQMSSAATPSRTKSPSPVDTGVSAKESETVDLFPELAKVAVNEEGETVPLFSKLEFSFAVKMVYLELFTKAAATQEAMKDCSLARFSLNDTDVKYKLVSNGSMEAEVLLRAFVGPDTNIRAIKCRLVASGS